MMIRGDWRYLRDAPPVSRSFHTAVALVAAVVFAAAWVIVSAMPLGALALRFL
jgi:hypothetical protein